MKYIIFLVAGLLLISSSAVFAKDFTITYTERFKSLSTTCMLGGKEGSRIFVCYEKESLKTAPKKMAPKQIIKKDIKL